MKLTKFVLAVCGADEHIKRVNISIQLLKHFSKQEIIVVTDFTRNKIAIEHTNIIAVTTPKHLNNHQAAIYLKTGLYRFLAPGFLYCYLDSDVMVIDDKIDDIFTYYQTPITFCTDHGHIAKFNLSAVRAMIPFRDGSPAMSFQDLKRYYRKQWTDKNQQYPAQNAAIQSLKKEFGTKLEAANKLGKIDPRKIFHIKKLLSGKPLAFRLLWQQFVLSLYSIYLQYIFPFVFANQLKKIPQKFHNRILKLQSKTKILEASKDKSWYQLSGFKELVTRRNFVYDIDTRSWYNQQGVLIFEEHFFWNSIQNNTYLKRLYHLPNYWITDDGHKLGQPSGIPLLIDLIEEKFDVTVTNPYWRHWNGGVFLFDEDSFDFLATWHRWSQAIWEDDKWETRDQGTLIATVWKYGLQNQPTLPMEFNFLVNYYKMLSGALINHGDFSFTLNRRINIQPHCLHFFDHYGNKSWSVWQDIEKLLLKIQKENPVVPQI